MKDGTIVLKMDNESEEEDGNSGEKNEKSKKIMKSPKM